MISEVDTDGVPSCLSLSAARWIESGVFRHGVIGVTYYKRGPDSVSGKSDGCKSRVTQLFVPLPEWKWERLVLLLYGCEIIILRFAEKAIVDGC